MAVATAREKAIPVNEPVAAELQKTMVAGLRGRENTAVQRMDSGGGLDSTLYTMSALLASKYPADSITDAAVSYIMSRQFTDGRWPREEGSRSPIQDGDINRAALAVSALQAFASPALKSEANEHIARARRWLMSVQPTTTDDRAMLLLGLQRSGAPEINIQNAAKTLLGLQRKDGGWAGNRYIESDAYATGEALGALFDTRLVTPRDSAYQHGVQFLLGTRAEDGSWHVRSRARSFSRISRADFRTVTISGFPWRRTSRAVVALSRYIQ